VLRFEGADPAKAIIVGVLREGRVLATGRAAWLGGRGCVGQTADSQCKEQVVLRFGKESITLTKAGKIFIQGTYVLNLSSGVNRIKGGSVQMH
jgi:hypothetical protein